MLLVYSFTFYFDLFLFHCFLFHVFMVVLEINYKNA